MSLLSGYIRGDCSIGSSKMKMLAKLADLFALQCILIYMYAVLDHVRGDRWTPGRISKGWTASSTPRRWFEGVTQAQCVQYCVMEASDCTVVFYKEPMGMCQIRKMTKITLRPGSINDTLVVIENRAKGTKHYFLDL